MVTRIKTVAFQGLDALHIDVQVQLSPGTPVFLLVGLPDKAVAESRERVRAALHALGLAMPAKRLVVNLSPADVIKEGSHFDLPIALGVLVAMGALPADALSRYVALGELALDGQLIAVAGVLPAAVAAAGIDCGIICPAKNGQEAAWAGPDVDILAPDNLLSLINHFKGTQVLSRPEPDAARAPTLSLPDLRDVKGQETPKRALEIAAAGGHNLLMLGPPGSGKSMLAARLPGILPPLSAAEALDISMVHSLAGLLPDGGLITTRPFRDPHHSASLVSLIGGGLRVKPGEISLAHHGVLFLDELPEFNRATIESLRQPMETHRAVIARANAHVTYPAHFQLVAAMNPCRCGHVADAALACNRAPLCATDYQSKISGPLFDRIDLHVDVPAVTAADLSLPPPAEGSADVAARVAAARQIQQQRYEKMNADIHTNAAADGDVLKTVTQLDDAGQKLLHDAAEKMKLSARSYHRVLRVARTIADLAHAENITRAHLAEALTYRRLNPKLAG